MIFQPALAALVLAGEKTVTRRMAVDNPRSPWCRGRCGLVVGRDYAVCPGRGKPAIGRVVIESVDLQGLAHLSATEARHEGFASPEDFEAAWTLMHGHDRRSSVWRVQFRAQTAVDLDGC